MFCITTSSKAARRDRDMDRTTPLMLCSTLQLPPSEQGEHTITSCAASQGLKKGKISCALALAAEYDVDDPFHVLSSKNALTESVAGLIYRQHAVSGTEVPGAGAGGAGGWARRYCRRIGSCQ